MHSNNTVSCSNNAKKSIESTAAKCPYNMYNNRKYELDMGTKLFMYVQGYFSLYKDYLCIITTFCRAIGMDAFYVCSFH